MLETSTCLFVLYHKLIHNARTHLNYFQEGNPGRALVILYPSRASKLFGGNRGVWEFGDCLKTGSRAGEPAGHWRLSKKICALTGVWDFKEFVQLQVLKWAFVQCPGHRIIVHISEFLEFGGLEKLYGPMPVVKYQSINWCSSHYMNSIPCQL